MYKRTSTHQIPTTEISYPPTHHHPQNPPKNNTQVYYRAVHACPWSKPLWLQAFLPGSLRKCFTAEERRDCLRLLVGKGLLVRVDPPSSTTG